MHALVSHPRYDIQGKDVRLTYRVTFVEEPVTWTDVSIDVSESDRASLVGSRLDAIIIAEAARVGKTIVVEDLVKLDRV